MSIICSGSVAFDRLMTYPGVFADSLIADKLDLINVCFLVDKVRRLYGGTAGNITYNLHLLGEKPILVGCLGDDPDGLDYKNRLESWGFSFEAIKIQEGLMTAGATIITDQNNNQFTFFHPGAMARSTGFDPATLAGPKESQVAIVSPGGLDEMKSLCVAYRQQGLKFIFDPGQQSSAFSGPELLDMLNGSFMLICNVYEIELLKQKTGLSLDDLFKYTETIIVTKGAEGSELILPGRGSQHIMAVPVRQVVDPTGAGDAFRAGLLKGLAHGEALITACRLGATVSAFCVEADGTQCQSFTLNEVIARHQGVFRETLQNSTMAQV